MKRCGLLIAVVLYSPPATAKDIKPLIQRYNNCVLTVSVGITGERHAAAEQSFFACRTEEQAIRTFLNLIGLPPANVDAAIVRRQLSLKSIILRDPQ